MRRRVVGTVKNSGFTIVELLVAIVVIGILVGIVIGASNGYFHNQADQAAKVTLDTASRKLDVYKLKNGLYSSSALTGYTPEANITLTQQSITATAYCLKVTSNKYSDITYYGNNQGAVTTTTC